MITSLADFKVNPYLIPTQPENSGGVLLFLQGEEKRELEDLLGSLFYKALTTSINALPAAWVSTVATVVNQHYSYGFDIWKALTVQTGTAPVASVDWELVESNNKWLRLKLGDVYEDQNLFERTWVGLVEMLKPCLHAMYLRGYAGKVGGLGVIVAAVENGQNVPPDYLISKHYSLYNQIAAGCDDSFFGYLYANAADFDDDVNTKGYRDFKHYLSINFSAPGFMNTFGL